mgnify:CR=1 FL=1
MNATQRIIDLLSTRGGISKNEAAIVMAEYLRVGALKVDGVTGGFSFPYGEAVEKKSIVGCLEAFELDLKNSNKEN